MDDLEKEKYRGCYIKDIRRGDKEKGRNCYVYASLYSQDGELLIMATLDYILEALHERMPNLLPKEQK